MSPEMSKLVPVSTPVTPRVPATVAFTSTSKVSICAVPSMYKSLHSCVELPRSYAPSSSGIMLESTSAPKTTLSAAESPRVSVPPLKVVVPVTVRLPPIPKLPEISALPFMSIVVAAIWTSVSATISSCPSALE